MKRLPKRVNVLGHDYSISVMPAKKIGHGVCGVTKFPDREIILAKELQGEMLMLTLLHELHHAFQFENGDMQILQAQSQEKACDQFASFILSLKKQRVL